MTSDVRRVARLCVVLAVVIILYWVAWFTHRSLVASENSTVYVNFEQAFPLADGFIVVFLLLSAYALWRRAHWALLTLLMGAGAGFYLGGMDVLFDLEHGIWTKGANGVVELAINVVTFVAALALSTWSWRHRGALAPSE